VILFRHDFVRFYLHTSDEKIALTLILIMIFPMFAVANGILGTRWMTPLGLTHVINRSVLFSAIVSVPLCAALSNRLGHLGGAISLLVSEGIVFICLSTFASKNNLNPFIKNGRKNR